MLEKVFFLSFTLIYILLAEGSQVSVIPGVKALGHLHVLCFLIILYTRHHLL